MPINLLILLLGLTFWTVLTPPHMSNTEAVFQARPVISATIGEKTYELEIADDLAKRGRGLSWRKSLAKNRGMLFLFEKPDQYVFVMDGMLFPLDFIWLKQGVVVALKEDVQPSKPDHSSTNIVTNTHFDQTIELNAGEIKTTHIKIGDRVSYF
ncbi:MAG: DUF192 domain-containing protein [Candidatus Margulisbacteria bacterium]|nr:DUF192 domain-containing protein [Candidatus Margulisiibacteriota bacterium]MBU1617392.1 DUF192 domain-containing protein [Candidatus Margulisiibacteriota bacterium]MBU1867022.1 DUF192 domain-containing protein [Candidatus Margulisiibacteriota bacterium]